MKLEWTAAHKALLRYSQSIHFEAESGDKVCSLMYPRTDHGSLKSGVGSPLVVV